MNGIELWEKCLRTVFNLPASIVIITGLWKTGKTDFGLLIYEELLRLKSIMKGGTNIETDCKELAYIDNMPFLKRWMFRDKISKLYIYDESISSTPKRRAMSKLNVEWLKKIIPQMSKGKAKLLVLTQELELTESVFYHPTFCRGIFKKLKKKTATLHSPLISKEVTFYNIPPTSIKFDPYLIAQFNETEDLHFDSLNDEVKVALLYSKGIAMDKIGESFKPKKHRFQVARLLRKFLNQYFKENKSQVTNIEQRI